MEPDAKLARILDECLARMREGKSVDVCLAGNGEMHDEVEPLLYTVKYVSSLPKVQPSEKFRRTAKGHLMARLHEEENRLEHSRVAVKPVASLSDGLDSAMQQIWQAFTGFKKVAVPVALGLIIIIASAMGAVQFMSPSPALAEGCTLSITSGTVEIMAPAGESRLGADGMTLEVGTRVKTATDATALLTFFDGSTLEIEPGTEIEIQQLESNDEQAVTIVLKQWLGRTWSSVVKMVDKGSRYEINTPSAVALVRGTRFLIDVDEEGKTVEQTTHGLVSVISQGEEVFVPAGQITVVEPGTTPSEPKAVPALEENQPQVQPDQADQVPSPVSINHINALPVDGQGGNAFGGGNSGGNDQGNSNGQGNANGQDNSNGQGNANGQDNASDNDKTNDNSQSQGNDNSQGNNSGGNGGGNGQGNAGGNDNSGGNSGGNDAGQGNSGGGNGGGNGQGNAGGNDNSGGNSGGNDAGQGSSGGGNGGGNGQGNGNDNAGGNGSDNGQGNGSDNGQGNGSDNAGGNGSDNGQGNGSDNGQGNGSDNGQGNGSDNGQGNAGGNDNSGANSGGNDAGQGNSGGQDNGGQGNGSDNGQGNNSSTGDNGQSNGNNSDDGQGNGDSNDKDEDKGNAAASNNDNSSSNDDTNGQSNTGDPSNGNGKEKSA